MNKKSNPLFKAIIFLVIMFAAFSIFSVLTGNDFASNVANTTTISQAYKEDKVKSVEITPRNNVYEVKATLKEVPGQKTVVLRENVITQKEIEEIAQKAKDKNVAIKVNPEPEPSNLGSFFFTILLFGGLFFLMSRMLGGKNSPMNAGENKARLSSGSEIKFTDVIGYEEEKQELVEVIEFLKNPSLFLEMGAKIPRGILLEGPPGTGKTLMAKAVAGEAGVPFYSISGSDFIEMFVGVGASRVRNLFKEAKKTGSCIVFIDEIDAIGSRDSGAPGGRNTEQEQTINALLVELDGFSTNADKGQVIIIGATNRADKLDPALLRPGRFDRKVMMGLPTIAAREDILKYHAAKRKMSKEINFNSIAKNSTGMSGAQLEAVVNEAAILAVREKAKKVSQEHVNEAIDRVLMGPAKITNKYSKNDKLTVAYHETGHAITGLELKDGMQVQKITIIPRRNAGGYVSYSENEDEDRFITKRRLEEMLITLMAGRASEELFIGEITTGAHNDFERATHIARSMITKYGMTELGKYQYESDDPNHVYRVKQYSNESAEAIDQKINEILDIAYNKAKEILNRRSEDVHLLAKTIQEVETLGKEEIDYLMEHRVLPDVVETEKFTDAEIKKVKKDHDKAIAKAKKEAQTIKDIQAGKLKVVVKKTPVKKKAVKKTPTKKPVAKKATKKDENEKTDSK